MKQFKTLLSATAILAIGVSAAPAIGATYKTDQGHTEVQFGWSHAGVSDQTAEFTMVDGTLELDPENPAGASLNVTIKADSLATGFGPLDEHVKSADFLDVATYPEITFVSTGVEVTGDKTANVTGDLTIHGTTLPITLETTMSLLGAHPLGGAIDYYKGDWSAFSATGVIEDHQAYGVGGFSTGPLTIRISTELKAVE